MAGALQILFETIEAYGTMTNVECRIGEKHLWTNTALPKMVMVPRSGSYRDNIQPGYKKAAVTSNLVDKLQIDGVAESVDFHLYAVDTASDATDADQYSAVEDLRTSLLQALKKQKQTGLYYVLDSERWVYNDAKAKYGLALIVTCRLEITVPTEQGHIAVITEEDVTVGLNGDTGPQSTHWIKT